MASTGERGGTAVAPATAVDAQIGDRSSLDGGGTTEWAFPRRVRYPLRSEKLGMAGVSPLLPSPTGRPALNPAPRRGRRRRGAWPALASIVQAGLGPRDPGLLDVGGA